MTSLRSLAGAHVHALIKDWYSLVLHSSKDHQKHAIELDACNETPNGWCNAPTAMIALQDEACN